MARWEQFIKQESKKLYFQTLKNKLAQRYELSTVYPAKEDIMKAFKLTPFEEVKVVILGQDPYHGPGQAHGLSFSVPDGVDMPPSLKNVFREVHNSMDIKIKRSGNLERWAKQGVLLLNSVLTVQAGKPSSHQDLGWQQFTDNAIKLINEEKEGVVFMLWGNYAKEKANLIDENKHAVLTATHPSPFSAHKGFLGCDHFWACNTYLLLTIGEDIDWS